MPNRSLEPGQYQIGEFVFGAGTQFNVEDFDAGGYEVNVQDYQAQLSDQTRMGSDSFKGLPFQFIIHSFENKLLPNMISLTGDNREFNFENDRRIGEFTREWRADEVRKKWGEYKPLYACRKNDGKVLQAYGRPGKLAVTKPDNLGMRTITAEYRRADTLWYNDFEWFAQIRKDEELTIFRSEKLGQGDAPSWFRLFLIGPMKNPTVNVGEIPVSLNWELEAGEIIEISSYPWATRVVRLNDGINLAGFLTQPYLSDLNFDTEKEIKVTWTATDANAQIEQEDFADYANQANLPIERWKASQYSAGTGGWRINDGKLVWDDAGSQNRRVQSIYQDQTITPYQTVGFTTASPAEDADSLTGEGFPSNRIIGRSNAAGTRYLFWEFSYTHAWYGYHKDGVDYQLSEMYRLRKSINIFQRIANNIGATLFGHDGNPKEGWQYDAEFGTGAGLLMSNLLINRTKLIQFAPNFTEQALLPFPLSSVVLDDDSHHVGIGMRATTRGTGQGTPAGLTEFHMRDNPVVPLDVSSVYIMWRDAWQNL